LEIIGEAASNVPLELRQHFSAIPWRAIIGTRNKLIHDYLAADVKIVFQTVTDDLPMLVSQLDEMMKRISENDGRP
jgi:uncharacterized protein with HEPN domain